MVSDLPEGSYADYLFSFAPNRLCSNIVIQTIPGFWNGPVSLRRCTVFVFKIWLLPRLTTPKTYDLQRLRKVACIQLRALEVLVVLHLPLEILSR
jgi:hypothetical protein